MSVFWFFKHMESSWCTAKAIHLMTFIVQRVIVVVWVASRRRTSTSYHIWLRHRHRAPYWLRVMWAIHTTVRLWRPTVPYIRDVTAVCVCDATHTWQLHDSRCLTPCRARPFWPCALQHQFEYISFAERTAGVNCLCPFSSVCFISKQIYDTHSCFMNRSANRVACGFSYAKRCVRNELA